MPRKVAQSVWGTSPPPAITAIGVQGEPILMIVEDTEKMMAKLPIIEMSMALVLAHQQGTETVDMKLDKDFCPSCEIYSVAHYHLIGSVR